MHFIFVVILGLVFALMIATASLPHFVEYDCCEALGLMCDGFESIPSSCWFAISTLATLGYGDFIPHTFLGKLIAVAASVCGVIMLALAGAMFSYDFSVHFRLERHRRPLSRRIRSAARRCRSLWTCPARYSTLARR